MQHSTDLLMGSLSDISRFAATLTMAELGLADQLADGPLGTGELAERCGVHAPSLRRVLRELAAIGLVTGAGPDAYALTDKGAVLRSDVPGSVRSSIRMLGEEGFWYAMGMLPTTVRDGGSAFVKRHGHLYEHLSRNPASSTLFDEYMAGRARTLIEGLTTRYAFPPEATLVDVAGGKGHILAAILHANPGMRGVLIDLEHVVERAARTLADEGLADRTEVVAGDFFSGVPAGGDLYLLASILHNWDDGDAVRILRGVRDSMKPEGRVLILEVVLPDSEEPHLGKDFDMRMLAIFDGGAERSREEYATLLDRAGLTLTDVVELGSGANLIEARQH